jgi:hypothetical protein
MPATERRARISTHATRTRETASERRRIPRPFAHPRTRALAHPRTHEQLNRPRGSGFVQFFVVPFSVITTVAVADPS